MFELIPFDRRGSRVSAYDPFRMLDDMERSFFGGANHPAMSSFRTDVTDTGDAFVLDAELPGFKKDEIKLELNSGYLTISTEKNLEKDEKNQQGKILRQERYSGTMQRSFYVGGSITEEDIKAKYENGVLSLMIPKKEAPKVPEKKQILIEG
jgi:HSP20 family molecular chaperone IbpA